MKIQGMVISYNMQGGLPEKIGGTTLHYDLNGSLSGITKSKNASAAETVIFDNSFGN